jgi:hypothetical protein
MSYKIKLLAFFTLWGAEPSINNCYRQRKFCRHNANPKGKAKWRLYEVPNGAGTCSAMLGGIYPTGK